MLSFLDNFPNVRFLSSRFFWRLQMPWLPMIPHRVFPVCVMTTVTMQSVTLTLVRKPLERIPGILIYAVYLWHTTWGVRLCSEILKQVKIQPKFSNQHISHLTWKRNGHMCAYMCLHVYAHICYSLGNCTEVSREFLHIYILSSLVLIYFPCWIYLIDKSNSFQLVFQYNEVI